MTHVEAGLGRMPAVVLLGPRQVGKTTLALRLA
jgi:predicted AAA+ superfamily ATPase